MAGTIVTLLNATTEDEALPSTDLQSVQPPGKEEEHIGSPRTSLRQDRVDNMSENAGSLIMSDPDTDDDTVGSDDNDESLDPVFEQIKKSLSKMEGDSTKDRSSSFSSAGTSEEDGSSSKVSEHFTSIPYGIQPKDAYEHGKKDTDIMGVTYNGRMRQFVLLDSKGIVCWKRDAVDNRIMRCMSYPKYEYRLITYLVYARKYNCYFALWKDFSLRVLNRDFCETCSVSADLRSVLFMLFNPIRDELITGGVGGIKVYRFHQAASKVITELKPLANYQLTLQYELPNVGGSWVKKVELDYNLEHLYCCSDTDLHVYNLEGKELFKFNRAHTMSITGCRYSVAAKVLVTSSIDTEVKVWSLTGGLVHTFRGHSRAVTNLLIHPHNSTLILTCSLDGSLRMWSLDTMDAIYSLVVSACGLLWMGLTDDNLLYISTARSLTLWHLNHFLHFWSLTRNQVTRLQLEGCPGKTQRVLAVGEDSSIRLFARSNQKNLSTVLPPPNVSPLQKILGVCYSREFNVIFVLINPTLIWVYTTRTDPACRIAVWDVLQIQAMCPKADVGPQERTLLLSSKPGPTHRATENGAGNELPCPCLCVCILKSSAMLWTDEGCCCPVRHSYLLLGMEDGRVLFMDPVVKGQKFMEFKVSKDPVVGLHHEVDHQCLTTVSRTSQLMLIQFWSLPDLELLHEVFCPQDLAAFACIGYMCVTGHESGSILFHSLELANDPGLLKGRFMPAIEEVVPTSHRPEHSTAVITVDACVPMNIFCSCSNDGSIKVWEEGGALLTEIMLDDTLSAACFLNKSADLIVAYQKHIFFISHSRVCPHLKPDDPEDHTFDKESYVYEDPAVVYEGVVEDPDPIDLENYLVPFEIEFSKDFLEGKLTLEPTKEESEESDEEGRLSLAPTDIYLSPPSTPGSLSMVDLTLRSEVSKYDLLQQMKSTLQMLIAREQALRRTEELYEEDEDSEIDDALFEKHKQKQKKKTRTPASKGGRSEVGQGSEAVAGGEGEETEVTGKKEVKRFEFPRFEGSPGPTPSLTPSSTPEAVSEAESSEEEQTDIEDQVKELLPPKKIPDMQLVAAAAVQDKVEKEMAKATKEDLPAPKRTRKAISDVEIDAETLMRGARHAPVSVRKEADHSHVGGMSSNTGERLMRIRFPHLAQLHARALQGDQERSHRAPVKKKSVVHRKVPKRGSRSTQAQDRKHAGKDGTTLTDVGTKSRAVGQEKHQPSQKSEPDAVDTEDIDSARTETISVDIKVRNITPVAPTSPTPGSQPQDGTIGRAEAPPLPSIPDREDRPASSKSYRSVKSAERRRPIEFLRDRPGTEVGMSPTAELESRGEAGDWASEGASRAGGISPQTIASTTDTTHYGPLGSLSGVGEGEEMSWVSSQEGDRQLMAEEEWEISMDEAFMDLTRVVSPASSVFTYNMKDSSLKGDHQLKGDYPLSRLLDSRQSVMPDDDDYMSISEQLFADRSERSGRSSVSSMNAEKSRITHRPRSAIYNRKRPSSSLLSSRPRSASVCMQYQRHSSADGTSSAGTYFQPRGSTPASRNKTPGTPSPESSAANTWTADAHINPESPHVDIRYLRGSGRSSCRSVSRLDSIEESACKPAASSLPPPVCPPDCICQVPVEQRDALLRRRKISFREEPDSVEDGGCPRLSLSGRDAIEGRGGQDAAGGFARGGNIDGFQRPPLPPSAGQHSGRLRHSSKGSDNVFETSNFEGERGDAESVFDDQGKPGSRLMSPRLPQSPRIPPSPRQRMSSSESYRNAVMSSSMSYTDAGGRESVLSGIVCPPSMADSLSERMGSPDSNFPDAELASISMRESSGQGDEDKHRAWSRIGLPDPSLAAGDRPSTTMLPARPEQFEHLIKRRPFTAANSTFQTELELMLEVPKKADELKAVFEAALHQYKKSHGDTSKGNENLYANKGVTFEDKWHERVLERHMLLRMQRVLRAHAAQQRRQMMSQQRVKSAPQHKGHMLGSLEAHSKLSRPKTANPSLLRSRRPTTAPAPSPAGSRPHTAGSRQEAPSGGQQKPTTLQEKLQHRQVQKEKEQLGDEQPFRLRMRECSGDSPPASPRQHKVRVDPWLLDPRNPGALRPPSSKSIPSKCSRYVLLSRPRTVTDTPTPTALEEELLAARFPTQSVRLLHSAGSALRPTPPHTSYGITYTPFSLYS